MKTCLNVKTRVDGLDTLQLVINEDRKGQIVRRIKITKEFLVLHYNFLYVKSRKITKVHKSYIYGCRKLYSY